jgi:hypothetical protein
MANGTKRGAEAGLERVVDEAHEERLRFAADMVRRIAGAEGRAKRGDGAGEARIRP